MRDALVFGGANALDFADVRLGVIRIPEVSLKIEEAQELWDRNCGSGFSFHHFLASEDAVFFKNLSLKTLSLAVVQLGLYDRFKRIFHRPQVLVGNVKNDSAMLVAAGLMSFQELIMASRACHMVRPLAHLQPVGDLVLNGPILPQYQAYERLVVNVASAASASQDGAAESTLASVDAIRMTSLGDADMSLRKVLERVVDERRLERIIHVGPGLIDRAVIAEFEARDLQIVESIDIDPMLGWFWRDINNVATIA